MQQHTLISSRSWTRHVLVALLGCIAGGPVPAARADDHAAAAPVLSVDQLTPLCFGSDAPRQWLPYRATLDPARWIWLPSQRTLPNTFVLFRKEVTLAEKPFRAIGWITADSRYRLTVNGQRVQWGPAPCDPRQVDIDPFDITALLRPGRNVIGVEVLFYGFGDGTWAAGKPGLLFHAVLQGADGKSERIVSDDSWQCMVDRAHPPGEPKRWYLRSLQEEFDARLHPQDWDTPEFQPGEAWTGAMVLGCPADKPPSCSNYSSNDTMDRANAASCSLRTRQIPPVKEVEVPVKGLVDSGRLAWRRDPNDWFEFRMPGCFEITREAVAEPIEPGAWRLPATPERTAVYAMFELEEQVVGFPHFEIDAPAGTIVELLTQEAHDPQATPWLDTQFYGWSRYLCREGVNRFEPFDFESLRWIQLHIRNAGRPVVVRSVGVRRRLFDWPHEPVLRSSEPGLQRLFDASVNTLRNSAIETAVDGMARERQQYSGDGGHQLVAIRGVFGEPRLSRRFLRTFSEGQSPEGYFLDCWPAFDRLARVSQKQVEGAYWGPILDHGVGFILDCWKHYVDTGDRDALTEPYPRLVRFAEYLRGLRDQSGLIPVEDLGIPTVWIDHIAYRKTRDKQCAFNLYVAAALRHGLAPMAELFDEPERAAGLCQWSDELLDATRRRFWSDKEGLFVDNLPWAEEDQQVRTSDRALATAILFDQCPEGRTQAAVRELADCPERMGFSYPCNACWRLWALGKMGRADVIVKDFRTRWATMRSVIENNTLQEDWQVRPDSCSQWSHCAVSPLFVTSEEIAGIRPTAPGFARCQIRPQLGGLKDLELVVHTPRGPIRFAASPVAGGHRLRLTLPKEIDAELVVPADVASKIPLPPSPGVDSLGLTHFRLTAGETNEVVVMQQ